MLETKQGEKNMKVKLENGMKFQSIWWDKRGTNEYYFTLRKHNGLWMCDFEGDLTTPLKGNVDLNDYMPLVDGIWINEPNEYIE